MTRTTTDYRNENRALDDWKYQKA